MTCENCNRQNTRYCGMCRHNDNAYYEQAIYDYFETKEESK